MADIGLRAKDILLLEMLKKINDQLNKWKRKYKKETFKFIEKGDLVEEK